MYWDNNYFSRVVGEEQDEKKLNLACYRIVLGTDFLCKCRSEHRQCTVDHIFIILRTNQYDTDRFGIYRAWQGYALIDVKLPPLRCTDEMRKARQWRAFLFLSQIKSPA